MSNTEICQFISVQWQFWSSNAACMHDGIVEGLLVVKWYLSFREIQSDIPNSTIFEFIIHVLLSGTPSDSLD